MIKCKDCGKESPEEHDFCSKCGKHLKVHIVNIIEKISELSDWPNQRRFHRIPDFQLTGFCPKELENHFNTEFFATYNLGCPPDVYPYICDNCYCTVSTEASVSCTKCNSLAWVERDPVTALTNAIKKLGPYIQKRMQK